MKSYLTTIIVSSILLVSVGVVFGQEDTSFTSNEVGFFYIDRTEYEVSHLSETVVKVVGKINDTSRINKVVVVFTLPDGSKTGSHVFTNDLGEFETMLPLSFESQKGEYTVFASMDGKIIGQISFVVSEAPPETPLVPKKPEDQPQDETPSQPEEIPTPKSESTEPAVEIQTDDGSYELSDGNLIYYNVLNGRMDRMQINDSTTTLQIQITSFGDGALTLGIPRHVLDAKQDSQDIDFVVRVNSLQKGYAIVETNQYDRVIRIDTDSSTSTVEITGTKTKIQQIQEYVLRVHVLDLPNWAPDARGVIDDATKFWEAEYPGLKFKQVSEYEPNDFFVSWVKDFGAEHVGYAYQNKFVEVGLGDSNCRGKWQPYSTNHVGFILKHEIGHILGLGHSSDPSSIMFPVAQNYEYGIETEDVVLTSGYGTFIPFCTPKLTTNYDISITTNDPKFGFNAYVVSSETQFQNFIDGKPINHLEGAGCYAENTLSFKGMCRVGKGGGIILIIDGKQTQNLTNLKLQIEEKQTGLIQTTEKSTQSAPICGKGTHMENGVCVADYLSQGYVSSNMQNGNWVKYRLGIEFDSQNEFLKSVMASAIASGLSESGFDPNTMEWMRFKVSDLRANMVTGHLSVKEAGKSERTISTLSYQTGSPVEYLQFVIPTNVRIGDVVGGSDLTGKIKVSGYKERTYDGKRYETIAVEGKQSQIDSATMSESTYTAYYDKKTGLLLEMLLDAKFANILTSASMNFGLRAIEANISNPTSGGGCLIATAAFGSELESQVQLLREVRDNVLFGTSSGTSFMTGFNSVYYSFSPTVADWERNNPVFKEAVKTAITPMLSTLSILNYVTVDSESEMLGYGVGIILLNIGIYFVIPVIIIYKLKSMKADLVYWFGKKKWIKA